MKKIHKLAVVVGSFAAPAIALAEGEGGAGAGFDSSSLATGLTTAFQGQITTAGTALTAVLTAGVVIVGCMYIWRLLKRAFTSAK